MSPSGAPTEAKPPRDRRLLQPHQLGIGELAIGLGVAALLWTLSWQLPIDMDELLPYHPIACLAEAQRANVWVSACGSYPTELGPFQFQRAFNYTGITTALLMLPIFTFSMWLGWHLLLGIAVLVASSLALVRSLGLPYAYSLAGIAWLPLALPVIHDTGPVRFSLLALVLTPLIVYRMATSQNYGLRILLLTTLSVLWIISTESKPFFLYLTPGIALWTLASLEVREKGFARQHLGLITFALGMAGVMSALLLLVLEVDGRPYLLYLADFGSPNSLMLTAGAGMAFLGVWPAAAQRFILTYPNVDSQFPDILQVPANFLPLTPDRGAPTSLILFGLSIIAVAGLAIWSVRRLWMDAKYRGIMWLLLLAAAALYFGAVFSRGGSVHHFVFAQVPILGIFLIAARSALRSATKATGVVLAVSAVSLLAILSIPLKPEVSPGILAVMSSAIESAEPGDVVNCQPWGCYYRYALENTDEVPIVWAETPKQQQELEASLRGTSSSVVHVCRDCSAGTLKETYASNDVILIDSVQDGWRAFKIGPSDSR